MEILSLKEISGVIINSAMSVLDMDFFSF